MEYEETTKISLDHLSQIVEKAVYMDGDIIIIDSIKELPVEGSLQMDMIIAILCTEGRLQVDVNGRTFQADVDDIIILPPNVLLDNYMISPHFNSIIWGLSYSALQRMLHVNKEIWDMVLYMANHPVFHLEPEKRAIVQAHYSMLTLKLAQQDKTYQNEIMKSLSQAVFYEMCAIVKPSFDAAKSGEDAYMKQGDHLVRRFLKLLSDSGGKERSVTVFAEKLCITPKYLTTVCRASSGKTALQWIHEYTTEVIVQRLKYSDRTIKEISDELEFPNLSFFGKFVRAQLGMSPTEYRRQWAENHQRKK